MRNFFILICLVLVNSYTVYGQDIMLLKSSGKVVIGDTSQIMTPGNYNLYVQNGILTERVKVALKTSDDWADGAFEKTPSLQQVESSIAQNKHLYDMPSVAFLLENGYELKEMDALLLKQIEWLWQHLLTMSEQNQEMALQIDKLKQKLLEKSLETAQK